MQVILRLYSPADVDLIALRLKHGSKFPNMVRTCISSYLSGERFVVRIPDNISKYARDTNAPLLVNLNLNDKSDSEIITYLSTVKPRARTDTIKTLIRSCYDTFPAGLFFPDQKDLELRHVEQNLSHMPSATKKIKRNNTEHNPESFKSKVENKLAESESKPVDLPKNFGSSTIQMYDFSASSEQEAGSIKIEPEQYTKSSSSKADAKPFVQESKPAVIDNPEGENDDETDGFDWFDLISGMGNH